ncbi:FAD-dependent oxidoreductase [Nocardia sp. NPDC004654]|uniref:NAD(P)/FAD-dependent oxidoreductase n=1 Tax=Nocardia sp. NPDC004654 TaxID=3154776 RepID=UPI0033BEA0AE
MTDEDQASKVLSESESRIFAGDVLVVGAGASGILAAQRLAEAGFSVTLMDSVGLGGAQSNHSHGYLHRGHIYGKPSPVLVKALCEGADRWYDLLHAAGVQPHNLNSCVGFKSRYTADVAERAWRRGGLQFEISEPPPGLSSGYLKRCFSTEESTYIFTPWFAYAATQLESVVQVKAEATSLECEGDTITGVVIRQGDSVHRICARYYVLAAGTGNLPLISSATNYRGQALNRVSYMMILAGRQMPNLSLVVPENDAYGLFLVSRQREAQSYWLVSNYLSYGGADCSENAAVMWLRATARLLRRATTGLDSAECWGSYSAPKGELRADRNRLDLPSVQSYGFKNVCVAAPTKLTLCPLLADDIVRTVTEKFIHPRSRSLAELGSATLSSKLPVMPELWESAQLYGMDELRRAIVDPSFLPSRGDATTDVVSI